MEEMMKQMQGKQKRTRKETVRMVLIVLFWLVLWEIADRVIDNRIILVGPTHILMALAEQVGQSDFWITCGASFLRIAVGFILSFIGGFGLALVCYRYKLIRDFLEPIMIMLKTVPMISFVIMLLIWVGNQALTIYLSFLIVLPNLYEYPAGAAERGCTVAGDGAGISYGAVEEVHVHLPSGVYAVRPFCQQARARHELEIRDYGRSHRYAEAVHRTGNVRGQDLSADVQPVRMDDCGGDFKCPV